MGPTRWQWLAAFTLAVLMHLGIAVLLAPSWPKPPPETPPPGSSGVEIALFPGFESALRDAFVETPDLIQIDDAPPGTSAAPLEIAEALLPESLPELANAVATRTQAPHEAAQPVRVQPTEPLSLIESTQPTVPLETVVTAVPIEAATGMEVVGAIEQAVPTEAIALAAPEAAPEPVVAAVSVPEPDGAVVPVEILATLDATTLETAELAGPAVPPVAVPQSSRSVVATPPSDLVTAAVPEPVPVPTASVEAPLLQEGPEPAVAALDPLAERGIKTATLREPEPATLEPLPEPVASIDLSPIEIVRAREPEPVPRPAEPITPAPPAARELAASGTDQPAATQGGERSDDDTDTAGPDPTPEPADLELAETAARPSPPGVEMAYLNALQTWLDRHKDYPRLAQRRGEEGTVMLRFTINRYGMVIEHAIVRSSGFQSLDNSVEHLIRRAQPMPPIPPEMSRDWMQIIVPVQFQLER